MNNKELREKFKEFCNTDNFSAPPYETDVISDWWLKVLDEEKGLILDKLQKKSSSAEWLATSMPNAPAIFIEDAINIIKEK